jgi:hypothetical protein
MKWRVGRLRVDCSNWENYAVRMWMVEVPNQIVLEASLGWGGRRLALLLEVVAVVLDILILYPLFLELCLSPGNRILLVKELKECRDWKGPVVVVVVAES